MLRGIEVGEILNTPKELVLLKTLMQEEKIDYLKTIVLYKSSSTDFSNQTSINNFNNLLKEYDEARNPEIKRDRDRYVMNNKEKLEWLSNLDLSKLNFGQSKKVSEIVNKKEGTIKII
jgi:hypothetical protein